MRSDMGRVVIERPRSGSSNPSLKARSVGRILLDHEDLYDYDGPLRIPSSGTGQQKLNHKIKEKGFTDLLGPLHGYFTSSVGRKWDDVFSELSRNLGAFSWPLQHIMRFHVDVSVNTYLGVDGRVYAEDKHGVRCVDEDSYRSREFYVHPITRVLCESRRIAQRASKPKQHEADRIDIGGGRWMVRVNGLWFIGTYRRYDYLPAISKGHWSVEYPPMEWLNFRIAYGKGAGSYLFTRIKSANKREIRRYGAANLLGRTRH